VRERESGRKLGSESGGKGGSSGEWVCTKMRIYFYARCRSELGGDEKVINGRAL
jgi:hypothetical protein